MSATRGNGVTWFDVKLTGDEVCLMRGALSTLTADLHPRHCDGPPSEARLRNFARAKTLLENFKRMAARS